MVSIRRAIAADTPVILRFIRELAEYEKLSHEVEASEETLRSQLFSDTANAWCLLAEVDAQPAGFAVCFYNFSTFLGRRGIYIEDIYVSPDYRGRKIGMALLRRIASHAAEEGCGRVEWSVLDWNKPAIDFYENIGARHRSGWHIYQLTGDALHQLATDQPALIA